MGQCKSKHGSIWFATFLLVIRWHMSTFLGHIHGISMKSWKEFECCRNHQISSNVFAFMLRFS